MNPSALHQFPNEALPPVVKTFVEATASAMDAPIDYIGASALVTLGAAIGNSRRIVLKPGWEEHPSIYAALVGEPGSMKSPSLNVAITPVRIRDQKFPDGRTWTSDATVEGLGSLLADNPRGLLLCRDELSGWIKAMNQYKGGKGADREFFLSVFTGEPIVIDRKNSPTINISNPFLAIVGGITPDNVPTLVDAGGKNDGFLERILFVWPDPHSHRWNDINVSQSVTDAYHVLVATLYGLKDITSNAPLSLTSEATAIWQSWHDETCAKSEDLLLPPFLRGAYTKFLRYGARLALIHALATDPQATAIGRSSLNAGIALIRYFEGQAQKVANALDKSPSDPVEKMKTAIVRRLSVCRSMEKRELQRNMNGLAKDFHQALQELSQPFININTYNNTIELVPTHRHLKIS